MPMKEAEYYLYRVNFYEDGAAYVAHMAARGQNAIEQVRRSFKFCTDIKIQVIGTVTVLDKN